MKVRSSSVSQSLQQQQVFTNPRADFAILLALLFTSTDGPESLLMRVEALVHHVVAHILCDNFPPGFGTEQTQDWTQDWPIYATWHCTSSVRMHFVDSLWQAWSIWPLFDLWNSLVLELVLIVPWYSATLYFMLSIPWDCSYRTMNVLSKSLWLSITAMTMQWKVDQVVQLVCKLIVLRSSCCYKGNLL